MIGRWPDGVRFEDADVPAESFFGGINNAIRALASIVKRAMGSQGAAIPSAATTAIGGAGTALYTTITGSATITSFGTVAAGTFRIIEFAGTLTLAHNATSLKLPGSANIVTQAGDVAFMISLGSGDWKCLSYIRANATPVVAPRGRIAGLKLSNNASDATNDIDIAVGEATADDRSALLVLSSALTKQLDAAWVAGNNQGGRDTGSIADGTWHVWLIRRPDTGVVDVLFSLSATTPTMPTNYTQKRRIGAIIRTAGAIVPFFQFGDVFKYVAPITDRSFTTQFPVGPFAVSVPTGIVVAPLFRVRLRCPTSSNVSISIGDAAGGTGGVVTIAQAIVGSGDTDDMQTVLPPPAFHTNASAQIMYNHTNTTLSPTSCELAVLGWVDRRGQDD